MAWPGPECWLQHEEGSVSSLCVAAGIDRRTETSRYVACSAWLFARAALAHGVPRDRIVEFLKRGADDPDTEREIALYKLAGVL